MSTTARATPLLTLALLGVLAAPCLVEAQPTAAQPTAAPSATPGSIAPCTPASAAPALVPGGVWTGTLRAGPIAARLRLTFVPGAAGSMGHARIIPDGTLPELSGEVRDLLATEGEVTFRVSTAEGPLRFTGARDAQGELRGRLTSSARAAPSRRAASGPHGPATAAWAGDVRVTTGAGAPFRARPAHGPRRRPE